MPTSAKSPDVEERLSEDHEALDKLLSELVAALDKSDAQNAFAQLDLFWARLAMHIRGENLHLFPTILSALPVDAPENQPEISSPAAAREAIARLRRDHNFFMELLAETIKIMRNAGTAADGGASKLETVRQMIAVLHQRLEAHNKLEEEIVYRLPATLLEPREQAALETKICNELKNLPSRLRDRAPKNPLTE